MKVAKSGINDDQKTSTTGEVISFRFSDDSLTDKKKLNNYDCESLFSYRDSLYLVTKRREDHQAEIFSLSKNPGTYVAHSLGVFDSKGLITDAAINPAKNELALIGYNKGHKFPFILVISGFMGTDFLKGKMERIELADKDWDWQLESIAYDNQGNLYFACEQTKEVKATFYSIKRQNITKLNKSKR